MAVCRFGACIGCLAYAMQSGALRLGLSVSHLALGRHGGAFVDLWQRAGRGDFRASSAARASAACGLGQGHGAYRDWV